MRRPLMELGTYRLISRLGAGGMGEVWRAEDTRLLRQVAIKILPEQLAKDTEWKDRFLREARTVAQLNHPNIATIYSIDQQGETLFIAMELIEGEALSSVIARGPMSPREAVHVATKAADGLSEAHAKGIVHRDIKPDNIIVSPKLVKVLDFGIAKQIGGTGDPSLTQGGMVVGTPHYMSPEQAMGRPIDARTDIFSLGVVLYEMLTTQKPFDGNAVTEILLQIVMNEPPDIAQLAPSIDPALANIVRRCMRKQADERYRDCEELHAALAAWSRDDGRRKSQSHVATVSMPQERSHPQPEPQRSPGTRPATPLPAAVPSTTDQGAAKARPSASATPRFRALVADDDPATRYVIGSILGRCQVRFDEAENGADAVRLLKSNDYRVVFLDLLMPRIDGWGVIDYLRNRRSSKAPKVFIITGVQNQKLSVADQDIVTGVVYKPIDTNQIEKLVSEMPAE